MNLPLNALHVTAMILAMGLICSTDCSSRSEPSVQSLGVQQLRQSSSAAAASSGRETTSVTIPSTIAVVPTCHVAGEDDRTLAACGRLRLVVSGVGHQHYAFNGTDWALFNATADLFFDPAATLVSIDDDKDNASSVSRTSGNVHQLLLQNNRQRLDHRQVIGQHFFLAQPDAGGGQPSWQITLNNTAHQDAHGCSNSSTLVTAKTLQAVSVDPNSIPWSLLQTTTQRGSLDSLGAITYIQRIATHGGLPSSTTSNTSIGDIYLSPYSTIYAFYISASS